MNLKDYVKDILIQLDLAVDEAQESTKRKITFAEKEDKRTIEFDIAVTTEETKGKTGKTGIKVLQVAEVGGNLQKENKNSTVSRVNFGLKIDALTHQEHEELKQLLEQRKQARRHNY